MLEKMTIWGLFQIQAGAIRQLVSFWTHEPFISQLGKAVERHTGDRLSGADVLLLLNGSIITFNGRTYIFESVVESE